MTQLRTRIVSFHFVSFRFVSFRQDKVILREALVSAPQLLRRLR